MAYGNATTHWDPRPVGGEILAMATTNAGGTVATKIFKGSGVGALIATGTIIIAADTAALVLVGVAAEAQSDTAAAGDKLKVHLPGTKLWLRTLDTAAVTKIGQLAWLDINSTNGRPDLVTATTPSPTNNLATFGRIYGFESGAYFVDTTLLGVITTAIEFA